MEIGRLLVQIRILEVLSLWVTYRLAVWANGVIDMKNSCAWSLLGQHILLGTERVDLRIDHRFLRFHPYGVGIDSNSSLSCYSPSAGSCVGSPLSRTTSNPQAGVWEVTVEARRTSDVENADYTLTASIRSPASRLCRREAAPNVRVAAPARLNSTRR